MASNFEPFTITRREESLTLGAYVIWYDVEDAKTGVNDTFAVTELVERFGEQIVGLIKIYDDVNNVPFIPGEILKQGILFFFFFSFFLSLIPFQLSMKEYTL